MDSNEIEGITKYAVKGCSKGKKISYCKKKDPQKCADEARIKKSMGL